MNLLGSLVTYGALFDDPPMVKLHVSFLLDVLSGELKPLPKGTEHLLPTSVQRGSDAPKKPNLFWDSPQYVCQKGTAFWDRALSVLRECGDTEAIKAVEDFLQTSFQLSDEDVFTSQGHLPVNKVKGWVVLAMGMTPITERPKVLEKCSKPMAQAEADRTGVCSVTGEEGPMANIHGKVVGIGQSPNGAVLVSYNMGCIEYDGREQGDNFHMSVKAARRYVIALNKLLAFGGGSSAHICRKDPKFVSIVFWPEGMKDHPIVPLSTRILDGVISEEQERKALWDNLRATSPDDSTPINIAVLRKASGRIVVMGHRTLPANVLRDNLLRFEREFNGKTVVMVSKIPGTKGEQTPILPVPDYCDLYMAVLTGGVYPSRLLGLANKIGGKRNKDSKDAGSGTFDWIDLRILRWIENYYNRMFPKEPVTHMTSTSTNLNTLREELRDKHLNSRLLEERNQPYLLGCVAALYGHLRSGSHNGKVKSSLPDELKRVANNPASYIGTLTNGQLYIEKLKKNRRYNLYLATDFEEFLGMIRPFQPTPNSRSNIALGFYQASHYLKAFSNRLYELRHPEVKDEEKVVVAAE